MIFGSFMNLFEGVVLFLMIFSIVDRICRAVEHCRIAKYAAKSAGIVEKGVKNDTNVEQ